jgi:hypothetical protein
MDMTVIWHLCGLATELHRSQARDRESYSIIQPAEEDGSGAQKSVFRQ